MQKAVIYTRVSTGQQVEDGTSLEVQELACLRKAQELGADVVDIIPDEGVSGAFYMSRPGIQKALKMLEDGKATLLITMKLDRTGRDVDIVRLIQKRVTNAGGRLIFADGMNFENNATGRLMLTQLAGFAEFERDLIRERTVGGKRRRAEEGLQTARTLSPFGYHIVTKEDVLTGEYPAGTVGTYQTVEHEAEIVREIFRLYSSGYSLRQICHSLQKRNIPTPRGGQFWIHTTVRLILSNPVHKGTPYYGRYRSQADERRIEQGKKARYRKGTNPSEWIALTAPALVSEEVWEQCQERLKESQARRSGNPQRVNALAGLLKCPKCRRRLLGHSRRYQNKNGTAGEERFFQCH
jgi:site-specific DNA recombinase